MRRLDSVVAQLGSLPVTLTAAGASHVLFAAQPGYSPEREGFHFANGDHVSTVPPGAVALARTADSPAVAIDFGSGWCVW
jgi:hypothetical protein